MCSITVKCHLDDASDLAMTQIVPSGFHIDYTFTYVKESKGIVYGSDLVGASALAKDARRGC